MGSDVSISESRPHINLGRYQVQAHIASGAMGAVYRAVDPLSGEQVAVKVLLPQLTAGKPALVDRFRQEALHGAKLRHENIVSLYEFGVSGTTYFLVMELVDGISLQDLLDDQGPLAAEEARLVLTHVARALDHAHGHGIVHRDVKPANILLARTGGRITAKLADFGLARETSDEEFRLTRVGCTVGTVDYMAPEQARNSSAADIRSDIYSLGCTIFHALTGRAPFAEGTLTERILRHAEAEPPDPRTFNPDIPAGLVEVLRRMLTKKPEERYQTPKELLDALLPRQRRKARPASTQTDLAISTNVRAEPQPARTTTAPTAEAASGRVAAGQFEWAREQLARGNRDYAVQLLLTCCQLDPLNLDYHQALRQALKGSEESSGGWLHSLSGFVLRLRFRLARRAGKQRQVLVLGAALLVREPANLDLQMAMAEAAEGLDAEELAVWMLEQAHRQDRRNTVVNRALGRRYEAHGDFDQAVACWQEVARRVPGDSEAASKLRDLAALQTLKRNRERPR